MKEVSVSQNLIMQGNEACARGALHAGCRFFSGYPITPSTEIIEYFAGEMHKLNGIFIQMEDEIASVCAAIGARWGGKKAMTATSGPGFSLMQEAIGYAAVSETPLVIVDVQRGGPSTGQPTMSAQQDIYQARYGSHGDYEIIALAPSSVQEMFNFTVRAFTLSERYRTPVILLADEIVGHMRENVSILPPADVASVPYVTDIVSPAGDFFQGGNLLVEGQFHDKFGRRIGHLAAESGRFVTALNKKISIHIDEISDTEAYRTEDAEVVFIAYGSVARPTLNAVQMARGIIDTRIDRKGFFANAFRKGLPKALEKESDRLKVGMIKVNTIWPFPEHEICELVKDAKIIVVPEMNVGRYFKEIKCALPGKKVVSIPKPGGEIHTPQELLEKVLAEVGVHEQVI